MRYCIFCKKPIYTSIHSIWIKGKNYDAHQKCLEDSEGNELKMRRAIKTASQPEVNNG